jgi:hypothetical protein
LSSNERGFLILEDVGINAHAVLISSIGKILFTKIYKKEIVLNGGDLVNETLILTGGKSNGEGIIPFIDVLRLKFNSGKGFFELTEERTHFLPGVGNRLDDLYVLNYSPGSFDLVVSKYETAKAKASYVVLMDLNRVSIMRVKVDSTLRILWETEIFKRNSKYSPIRDLTFQMKYDPDYQRVVAFYSLADERSISAHLFSMDTLGKFELQKKIKINELTFLRDVYSAREGIYFCGWTEVGIDTPFLGFGQQGLFGFVANDGRVSSVHVGRDRQGYNLSFYKIRADSSLNVWATRTRDTFVGITNKWELMKFDRPLF